MDAKELMIGDWVCGALGVMKVVSLGYTITGHRLSRDGTIHETDCNPNFVSPIPLTEEMLLANNFNPMEVSWSRDQLLGGLEFAFESPIDGKMHGLFGIRYVHSLQHFLRIFGKFDLADNFKV